MPDQMNVRRVAELAKIALTSEEEARMSVDMEGILVLARQLQSLDTTDVPQTQHVLEIRNVFREDALQAPLAQSELLDAAPAKLECYIAVPRTVE